MKIYELKTERKGVVREIQYKTSKDRKLCKMFLEDYFL